MYHSQQSGIFGPYTPNICSETKFKDAIFPREETVLDADRPFEVYENLKW